MFQVDQGISCLCMDGLVGDGKLYCNPDVLSTVAMLDMSGNFYQVEYYNKSTESEVQKSSSTKSKK